MPGRTSSESAHIKVWVVVRGINLGLHTRIYFVDFDNEGDILLNSIVSAARAATLVAKKTDNGYNFDICFQGEKETVFLNV
jgi:protocatechuate 3,4-dioxygenase, alpha subunit